MAKPRAGFKGRLVEMPLAVWADLDALAAASGLPYSVLMEDAITRYCVKPPKRLPVARKRGPKPKPSEVSP